MNIKKIIPVFFTFFSTICTAQQVINIEGKRFEDPKPGWQGNVEFNFNLVQVQNQIVQGGNKFSIVHHDSLRNWMFVNDLNLVRANGQNLLNNGYQHLRYVSIKDSIIRPEAYAQTQFNQQMDIEFRFITGAGYRFRVVKKKKFFCYAGTSMMYEYERNPGIDPQHNIRNNTYLSLDFKEIKQLPFSVVVYYQPNIINTDDYRIATDIRFLFLNETHFSFKIDLQYVYDTYPPPGIQRDFYNITNAITYSF